MPIAEGGAQIAR